MRLADFYFRCPLIFDVVFIGAVVFTNDRLVQEEIVDIPECGAVYSNCSDLINVSLTSAGFVLTLLTIIITFSLSASQNATGSRAKKFVESKLYDRTISHLKINASVLVVCALLLFFVRTYLGQGIVLYLSCTAGFFLLITTLFRTLFILSQIVGLK